MTCRQFNVKTPSQRLIVFWGPENEADYQTPNEVKWEDGTPATLEDYRKHQSSTRTSQLTDRGHATVLFPDVSSVTRFDVPKGHWVVEASNGDVLDLLEADPNASDQTLLKEISMNPVIYQTTVDRSHLL
jgi:hypothetical protein